jgi:hypothetical protein
MRLRDGIGLFASFAYHGHQRSNEMKHQPYQLFATTLMLGYAALSFASDNSVTVFPAEGNKQCSDYAANGTILQMATSSPVTPGTLSGPENLVDDPAIFPDATGETAAYAITDGTVMSFTNATTPIDFALLKSGRDVTVIIYPLGGVTSDSDMRLTVAGLDEPITAISLCYGLGNVAPPPPPPPAPLTLKSCDTVNAALDFTGVSCPTNTTERQLVCNFELDKPFYGLKDGSDSCCVCNSPALTECNPDLPAGTIVAEGERPACPDPKGTPLLPGQLQTEVTTHIELNNDPYYCYTVGSGPRTCYKY